MKLKIEIVPQTSWYNNVRSNVSKEVWDQIRRKCYANAKHRCEICGSTGKKQGYNHNVECHEIWYYNKKKFIQKLTGFIALCPMCHKVKHIGLAQVNGEYDMVFKHLKKVNGIDDNKANCYIEDVFEEWKWKSRHNWVLDIEYLNEYKKDDYDNLMDKLKNL